MASSAGPPMVMTLAGFIDSSDGLPMMHIDHAVMLALRHGPGDMLVLQLDRKRTVGEVLLDVRGQREVDDDRAKDAGFSAVDVEHVDVREIDTFDPNIDPGPAEILTESDLSVPAMPRCLALVARHRGRGRAELLRYRGRPGAKFISQPDSTG